MTDKLYSQAELNERVRLAEAAALRDALFILENKLEGLFTGNETEEPEVHFLERDFDDAVEKIRALIFPAASLALDRLIAKEREDAIEECIQALWERVGREEYGHAKAAVALDIEALAELRRAADVAEAPLSGEGEKE